MKTPTKSTQYDCTNKHTLELFSSQLTKKHKRARADNLSEHSPLGI